MIDGESLAGGKIRGIPLLGRRILAETVSAKICDITSNLQSSIEFCCLWISCSEDATGLQSGPTSREGNVVVQAIWMVVFGGALDAGF
jgi:hypothetical protein